MADKVINTKELNFVKFISRMHLNDIGAAVYTSNASDVAYIVCEKRGKQIPYANTQFESLDELNEWIHSFSGNAAGVLDQVLEKLLPERKIAAVMRDDGI